MTTRSILALIVFGIQAKLNKVNLAVFDETGLVLMVTSFLSTIALFLSIWSLKYIPVTIETSMSGSYTIISMIFAYFLLGESMPKMSPFCMLLMIVGLTFLMSSCVQSDDSIFGYILCALHCLVFSIVTIGMRAINQMLHH